MILTNRTFTDRKSQKCETVRGKTYGGEVCEKKPSRLDGNRSEQARNRTRTKNPRFTGFFFSPNANEMQCNLI